MLSIFSDGSRFFMTKSALFFCVLPLLVFAVFGCSEEQEVYPEIVGSADYSFVEPVYVPKAKPIKKFADSDILSGWIPPSNIENKQRWKGIVIHHSAIDFGSAK